MWEASVQQSIDTMLYQYGFDVRREVSRMLDPTNGIPKGPSPHTGSGPGGHNYKPSDRFYFEDTGDLANAVEDNVVGRGFLRTVEIFVNPIENDEGELVDYGTFLEVGWHPMVPVKGGGVKPSGKFYAYPWLSVALAHVNNTVLAQFESGLKKGLPQFHVFGKARSEGGTGTKVQANKFMISENITSSVDTYSSRVGGKSTELLTGWLKSSEGIKGVMQVPGIRSRKVQEAQGIRSKRP